MKLFKKILIWYFDWKGWKYAPNLFEGIDRAVVIGAPHTSNWDFIVVIAYFLKVGVRIRFAIKKEWLTGFLRAPMERLGAIGIDRSQHNGTTESLTQLFREHSKLLLVVTPEGTRKKVTKWKSGFYYVALASKVPIALGYIDYLNRQVGVGKLFYPTGNYEADMKEITAFYRQFSRMGKNPEQFSLDHRFL